MGPEGPLKKVYETEADRREERDQRKKKAINNMFQ